MMNKKLSPEDAFYENLTLGLIRTLCEYETNKRLKSCKSGSSQTCSQCAKGM